MRLVDCDALEKRLEHLWNISDESDFANKEVWHALSEAPTIDVPDRKVGEWIYYPRASGAVTSTAVYFYPVCSVCGCEHPVANYCPNCGSLMRCGDV